MKNITEKSALTKKYQITIPKKIREFLKINKGDTVNFIIENNEVKLKPVRSKIEENFGKVKPKNKPEDFNKIRNFIEAQIAQEVSKEIK
ncbi:MULTISPECIES: AbrB/MazE/SpoVT family DNA-binding domain-containing protein [Thermodesulfovibrio]|uniref:SpoVT / AbrB like domain protein n=1 Tax=Thermodesulfovibrio yellowstonii (strain ATCC 51303 / DSM 11347 / YP87) TaxID=289376 RepID=B5YIC5_THEYD|nr:MULTISPECIES: AbrB/MazE/SpoVT family DNA-binding domain-containing protein [Thermodesulfovibrio]ACI20305.1 SpoVT / AbrB like domain protein [Thermodesulfovibrio yellowstonii DSM 11347]